jgi:hypothetical protein
MPIYLISVLPSLSLPYLNNLKPKVSINTTHHPQPRATKSFRSLNTCNPKATNNDKREPEALSPSLSTSKETKSPPSATVFGQKPTKLAVKILRNILTSYGHKLKAQELRRDLLEQVVCMGDKVSEQDRRTIWQLLEDKVEVTGAAITAVREYDGPANVADDDDEEGEEKFRRDEYEGRHSQRWRSSNHWREHPRQRSASPAKARK